jgi:dihydroorotase
VIAEGANASLSQFNPDENWVFSEEHILSKSKNSAFLGAKMKGRPYGIYHNQKLVL